MLFPALPGHKKAKTRKSIDHSEIDSFLIFFASIFYKFIFVYFSQGITHVWNSMKFWCVSWPSTSAARFTMACCRRDCLGQRLICKMLRNNSWAGKKYLGVEWRQNRCDFLAIKVPNKKRQTWIKRMTPTKSDTDWPANLDVFLSLPLGANSPRCCTFKAWALRFLKAC